LLGTCSICGSSNVEYICTKCGSLFCNRCLKVEEKVLLYCKDCGSDSVSQIKSDDKYSLVCNSCGSKNIGQGKKIFKSCPTCGGEVKKITQLLQQTKTNFKLILSKLNKITTDFLKVNMELSNSKENLLTMRRNGYFIKSHLDRFTYELIVNFEAVINQTLFYLSQIEKHKVYPPKDKNALLSSPTAFLNLDKEIAKTIANLTELNQYLMLALKEIQEKIRYLNSELLLLKEDMNFIESHSDLLNLSKNEIKLGLFKDVKITKSDFIKKAKQEGILILTNERLTFLSLDKKRKAITKGFRLSNKHIIDVSIEGKRNKTLNITVTFGTINLYVPKENLENLFNMLKILPYTTNGNNSYLMPVTLENYSPDVSKITTKISAIIKQFKNTRQESSSPETFGSYSSTQQKLIPTSPQSEKYVPSSQNLDLPFFDHSEQHQKPELVQPTYNNTLPPAVTFSGADYDLLNKLESRRQAILKSIEMLERHFQEGRITYDAYIKYYTSLYAEYYRIEGEIQRIRRSNVVTKL